MRSGHRPCSGFLLRCIQGEVCDFSQGVLGVRLGYAHNPPLDRPRLPTLLVFYSARAKTHTTWPEALCSAMNKGLKVTLLCIPVHSSVSIAIISIRPRHAHFLSLPTYDACSNTKTFALGTQHHYIASSPISTEQLLIAVLFVVQLIARTWSTSSHLVQRR